VSAPGYRLVPLDCPTCGAAVHAEGHDLVYYCTACRNGYVFAGEAERLERVEVAFVAHPGVAAERYLPFWLLPAKVALHERAAGGGAVAGFLSSLFGGQEAGEGAGTAPGEAAFAVPACHLALAETVELTLRYTRGLPGLGERLGERLTGGRYSAADARKLAHFALIAAEARRADTLTQLRYEIDFGPARLLGVPFVRRGDGLVDAIFGLPAALL
jgi:hypothetical protein